MDRYAIRFIELFTQGHTHIYDILKRDIAWSRAPVSCQGSALPPVPTGCGSRAGWPALDDRGLRPQEGQGVGAAVGRQGALRAVPGDGQAVELVTPS